MAGHRDEQGASLVEYTLLIALLVLASLVALRFFGASLLDSLTRSGSRIVSAIAPDLISVVGIVLSA